MFILIYLLIVIYFIGSFRKAVALVVHKLIFCGLFLSGRGFFRLLASLFVLLGGNWRDFTAFLNDYLLKIELKFVDLPLSIFIFIKLFIFTPILFQRIFHIFSIYGLIHVINSPQQFCISCFIIFVALQQLIFFMFQSLCSLFPSDFDGLIQIQESNHRKQLREDALVLGSINLPYLFKEPALRVIRFYLINYTLKVNKHIHTLRYQLRLVLNMVLLTLLVNFTKSTDSLIPSSSAS